MYERVLRPDELYHHGVMGMKWGVRRYQNPDGTLTSAGKARLQSIDYDKSTKTAGRTQRNLNRLSKRQARADADANEYNSASKAAEAKGNTIKAEKLAAKGQAAMRTSEAIGGIMSSTIHAAQSKGQKVENDHMIQQYMYSGKQLVSLYAASYMFGIPGYLVSSAATVAANPEREIVRRHYKATKPKH